MVAYNCHTISRRLLSVTNNYIGTYMAKSSYEYVRNFEIDDTCLRNTWILVRIDGKNFHKFTEDHECCKPNDKVLLRLMNIAARKVMVSFRPNIVLAYGQSDEYSFAFRPSTDIYKRRSSKLMSQVVSLFSSSFVYHWSEVMAAEVLDVGSGRSEPRTLLYPPVFDARVVLYPTDENFRDYFSWRQADCHINNLYNTVFWALIQRGGLSTRQAEQRLLGTLSADKNELLFSQFGINYNNEPLLFRKGSVLVLLPSDKNNNKRNTRNQQQKQHALSDSVDSSSCHSNCDESDTVSKADVIDSDNADVESKVDNADSRSKADVIDNADALLDDAENADTSNADPDCVPEHGVILQHCDLIGNEFWTRYPHILQRQCKYKPPKPEKTVI